MTCSTSANIASARFFARRFQRSCATGTWRSGSPRNSSAGAILWTKIARRRREASWFSSRPSAEIRLALRESRGGDGVNHLTPDILHGWQQREAELREIVRTCKHDMGTLTNGSGVVFCANCGKHLRRVEEEETA